MKRLIILFLSLLIVALLIFIGNLGFTATKETQSPKEEPEAPSIKGLENTIEISVSQRQYRIGLTKIEDNKKLTLIPNFAEKSSSKEIINTHACIRAINGGFYTTSDKPLGLFVIKDTILGEVATSELTNGFFWVTKRGEADIAKELPQDWSNLLFIFQTGPLVKLENESIRLSIINDEPSRRMFVGTDNQGSIFFFTVFDGKHPLNGPYLAELPEIVKELEEKVAKKFVNVINLDGGTASTFYNGDFSLEELVLVGSILCEKE